MKVKDRAVSSLLQQVDNEPNEKKVQFLRNELALHVSKILKTEEEVDHVFAHDRSLINASRDVFNLLGDDVGVITVLNEYYRGTMLREDDSRTFSQAYLLSELMMMLGTFGVLMESRSRSYEKCVKLDKKVTKEMAKLFSVKTFDKLVAEEEAVKEMLTKEERIKRYYGRQTATIFGAIFDTLGLEKEDITDKRMSDIYLASIELAITSRRIKRVKQERWLNLPPVEKDMSIISLCGEDSTTFANILRLKEEDKPYEKRIFLQ